MSSLQALADRFEIEALRGEFTDAGMMRDCERFACLFTHDGVWRMPHINVALVGRERIRAPHAPGASKVTNRQHVFGSAVRASANGRR